ncbi:hypothetical protein [Planctomycetes bacterium K23_9]|uniref:Chromosome partition protein Smc n=1 Tax=Stieleria marina TaxID=1930275 RepID=A0A517NZX3_9BACT|nr:hypothetical protein K239x_46830 [Planctomycetes bacterium K23_9]
MTVSQNSAAHAHSDHRHWKSDAECWLNDIQNWRMEHSAAIVQLQAALSRVNEHGQALDEHDDSVKSLVGGLEHHEKALAESLQDGSSASLDEVRGDQHTKQADLHCHQQDAHERIKKHHHQAMATVAMLTKALQEPV